MDRRILAHWMVSISDGQAQPSDAPSQSLATRCHHTLHHDIDAGPSFRGLVECYIVPGYDCCPIYWNLITDLGITCPANQASSTREDDLCRRAFHSLHLHSHRVSRVPKTLNVYSLDYYGWEMRQNGD